MPIDPNIALNVQVPTPSSPLQTIGAIMQMRNMGSEMALRQAQTQQAQQQAQDLAAQAQGRVRDLQSQNTVQELMRDPKVQKNMAAGDYSDIYNAGVTPTVADAFIKNHQGLRTTAQTLEKGKAEFYATGRSLLQKGLEGLDPTDDAAAAQQYNNSLRPNLATEHPELAAQLPEVQPGPDFRKQIQNIAANNGVAHAILEDRAALDAKQAETDKAKAEGEKNLADAGELTLKTQLLQAQTDHYKTLTSNPQALRDYVNKSVDPVKYPDENARALNEAQNAPDLKGINEAIVKHSQIISEREKTIATETDPTVRKARIEDAGKKAIAEANAQAAAFGGTGGAVSQTADDVANYRIPFSQAVARLPGPAREALLAQIKKLNPDFQAAQYDVAKKTEEDATTGKIAKSANALNTMMGHLSVLQQAGKALAQNDTQVLNRIAGAFGVATGKDAKTTYDTIVHRVGPEVTTAYLAAGGSVGERGTNEEDFASKLAPGQRESNIAVSAQLADSKIKALQDQYNRGTYGRGQQKLISEEAEATRQRLAGKGVQMPGAGTIHYTSKGKGYDIPAAQEAEFLKDHPGAQK